MPRDGSGIYTTPAGTTAVPDTTIESAKYNGNVADVAADLNAARPVVAGGTGATSAAAARTNLKAEVSATQVVNYDTHIFEPGSFYSLPGATGAPTAASFVGICYGSDNANITVEARVYSDTVTPWRVYVRSKVTGSWVAAWALEGSGSFVETAGDTMTGNLTIQGTYPGIVLNANGTLPATSAAIAAKLNGVNRWVVALGNEATAQDFGILGYDDAAVSRTALRIERANGAVNIEQGLRVTNTTIASVINWSPSIGYALFAKPLDATAGNIFGFQNLAAGVAGSIAFTASQAGVTYNTASDERLKQHREELVQTDARAVIDALRVYDYDKDGNEIRGIGLIAQQAYGVHKSLATPPPANAKEGEDVWMLEKAAPVAFLIANVQQLNARIDELEALLAQFKPPEKPA